MLTLTTKVAAAAILIGGAVAAGPAGASVGPECVGDSNNAVVCVTVDPKGLPTVNPTGGPGVHDCIFLGAPPCTDVTVPTPSVSPGSDPHIVQIGCRIRNLYCVTHTP